VLWVWDQQHESIQLVVGNNVWKFDSLLPRTQNINAFNLRPAVIDTAWGTNNKSTHVHSCWDLFTSERVFETRWKSDLKIELDRFMSHDFRLQHTSTLPAWMILSPIALTLPCTLQLPLLQSMIQPFCRVPSIQMSVDAVSWKFENTFFSISLHQFVHVGWYYYMHIHYSLSTIQYYSHLFMKLPLHSRVSIQILKNWIWKVQNVHGENRFFLRRPFAHVHALCNIPSCFTQYTRVYFLSIAMFE
jgi:hypothetical protein